MSSKNNPLTRFFGALLAIYRGIRAVILNLIFLLLVIILLSPLLPQPQVPIAPGSALVLNPMGILVEQESLTTSVNQIINEAAGGSNSGEVLLKDLLDAIDFATTDERISTIVLMTDWFQGGGFSQLQDVALALEAFKESGKKIIATGSSFNQAQYYLASHADEVLLNPLGGVELEGFGAWQLYYREGLDKLGINTHVFRVGEYKAAVEPYERNDMSDAARENYTQLLGELWALYLDDIGKQRDLTPDFINDYINRMDVHLAEYNGDTSLLAQAAGFVDRVESQPQTMSYLQQSIGSDDDSFKQISYLPYLARSRSEHNAFPAASQIGVIVASGEIQDGQATPGNIGGDSLSALIRQARENDKLKALVLRIDSPGGSVFASELIREELVAFKASRRPLIVSMGSVAASGGYWISTPADEIWASPSTITGSIGIFGVLQTLEDTFSKLGISVDGVGTTALSGSGTLGAPLSDLASKTIQQTVSSGYRRFLSLVASSRDMSIDEVDAIAQGRIWSGQAALDLDLVDSLGNLDDVIERAATLAGLEDWDIMFLEPALSPLQAFVKEVLNNTGISVMLADWQASLMPTSPKARLLLELSNSLEEALKHDDPNSLYVRCIQCTNLKLL